MNSIQSTIAQSALLQQQLLLQQQQAAALLETSANQTAASPTGSATATASRQPAPSVVATSQMPSMSAAVSSALSQLMTASDTPSATTIPKDYHGHHGGGHSKVDQVTQAYAVTQSDTADLTLGVDQASDEPATKS